MIEGIRQKGSDSGETGKRKLILCLDGTWNNKDSSTSILSLFNLINPKDEAGVPQVAYYDEGVGTGVLDGITGGGFGLGLDANVREAYNWLIGEYEEGDDVYIFGFSRGAYTARSLVGFIASCGLLRRGAPMTVSQLWEGYTLLGLRREMKELSSWEKLAGRKELPFRRISRLAADPFDRGSESRKFAKPKNVTEKLLVECSRRIPIQFLGIFDTVGAMGWEALAIPGLRSKLSVMHNMYVTRIIQNCRHALAIDENRSSFVHTPMHQWLDDDWNSEEAEKEIADWARRVEQRWFVGAHSNIGGGYPDNLLSVSVLDWMMQEAASKGLSCASKDFCADAEVADRRDSYAEFAAPLWTKVLRAKRHWRRIGPPVDVKAATRRDSNGKGNGYARLFIDEAVHPEVRELAEKDPEYTPPNLIEYAARKSDGNSELSNMALRKPGTDWLDEHRPQEKVETSIKDRIFSISAKNRAFLIVWVSLAAVGLLGVSGMVNGLLDHGMSGLLLASIVFFLIAVDWVESKTARSRALQPQNGFTNAFGDAVYWARAAGVVLFFIGVLVSVVYAVRLGIGERGFDVPGEGFSAIAEWWALPVAGIVAVGVVDAMDRRFRAAWLIGAGILSIFAILAGGIFLAMIGSWLSRLFPNAMENFETWASPEVFVEEERLAGLLLLLQIGLFAQWKGFTWVGEPMRSKRLGSIVALQKAWTPEKVTNVLQDWRDRLVCKWEGAVAKERASERMRCAVIEAIHRDRIGFIPLYSAVIALGFYIFSTLLGESWWSASLLGMPFWGWLVALTAGADYLEDALHLHFVNDFEKHEPSRIKTAVAGFAVTVKMLGVGIGVLGQAAMAIWLSWLIVAEVEAVDWRGALAGTISIVALLFIAGALVVFLLSLPGRSNHTAKRSN